MEEIWNTAEYIDQQFPEEDVEAKINRIKATLDKINTFGTFPSKQAELVGEALFDLCGITFKLNINSAASLKLAIENRNIQLQEFKKVEKK